ncbi:hypothetical protein EGR_09798 [Echinococcus granulosus]|uniref:Uncharacterized protein n=1 Tax=Echinococcus granulosus TaxID=6210 RepID=W6U2J1_ECHGR|nr:hypothetical protein EGR_09798 [Echinococcus granulosus]EUB55330.1 hypothetical protein EGR_09798 [Echinococcus granulosus]
MKLLLKYTYRFVIPEDRLDDQVRHLMRVDLTRCTDVVGSSAASLLQTCGRLDSFGRNIVIINEVFATDWRVEQVKMLSVVDRRSKSFLITGNKFERICHIKIESSINTAQEGSILQVTKLFMVEDGKVDAMTSIEYRITREMVI